LSCKEKEFSFVQKKFSFILMSYLQHKQ